MPVRTWMVDEEVVYSVYLGVILTFTEEEVVDVVCERSCANWESEICIGGKRPADTRT